MSLDLSFPTYNMAKRRSQDIERTPRAGVLKCCIWGRDYLFLIINQHLFKVSVRFPLTVLPVYS